MKTKKTAAKKLTIGLDLGDRRHHACVLDAAGEIVTREVIVNTPEVLTAFCARYRGATIVMETGTHSPWVSRLVAKLGLKVIVANARKLRAISESQTKNDEEDAEMLARPGRADPKLRDAVDLVRHPDCRRNSGCCGRDGLDGKNLLCSHGHEVATEKSDCWMPHRIIFSAADVKWID